MMYLSVFVTLSALTLSIAALNRNVRVSSISILVFSGSLAMVFGCNRLPSELGTEVHQSVDIDSHEPHDVPRIISNDIGLVLADSARLVHFEIVNDSPKVWTIASVEASCRCTTASVDRDVIAPGAKATFAVRYKAPRRIMDDSVYVVVRFKELEVPDHKLIVLSQVREFLSIVPSEFNFGLLTVGCNKTFSFSVGNYSGETWSVLSVRAEGATTTSREIKVDGKSNLLQAWEVDASIVVEAVTRDAVSLPITVEGRGANGRVYTETVYVSFRPTRDAVAIPSEIDIGEVRTGGSGVHRLRIIFLGSTNAEDVNERFQLTGKHANWFTVSPKGKQGKVLEVEVNVSVPREVNTNLIDCALRIEYESESQDKHIVVPLTGLIEM